MTLKLRSPDAVRAELTRRFQRHRRTWLRGDGEWPLLLPLGEPTAKEAMDHGPVVQQWTSAWQAWQGQGAVIWTERRFPLLGAQRWPTHLSLADAASVAAWIGEQARWRRATERYRATVARWPVLADHLTRLFEVMADYDPADFDRLIGLIGWLAAHPRSGLFPRQLPISGLHSKWLEPRKGMIRDLAAALQGLVLPTADFYQVCGLRAPPQTVRLRLLDAALRDQVGGLDYVTAPIGELERLNVRVRTVLIVENLQTGLALPDLPGTVAIMALGYSVDVLGRLPWVQSAQRFYWGDIDTHGLAILSRARGHVDRLESLLMDDATLLRHRDLWGVEQTPSTDRALPHLTEAERRLYQDLQEQRWGPNVRLEQERIGWDYAVATLQSAIR
jgi:hypothetical protein